MNHFSRGLISTVGLMLFRVNLSLTEIENHYFFYIELVHTWDQCKKAYIHGMINFISAAFYVICKSLNEYLRLQIFNQQSFHCAASSTEKLLNFKMKCQLVLVLALAFAAVSNASVIYTKSVQNCRKKIFSGFIIFLKNWVVSV